DCHTKPFTSVVVGPEVVVITTTPSALFKTTDWGVVVCVAPVAGTIDADSAHDCAAVELWTEGTPELASKAVVLRVSLVDALPFCTVAMESEPHLRVTADVLIENPFVSMATETMSCPLAPGSADPVPKFDRSAGTSVHCVPAHDVVV